MREKLSRGFVVGVGLAFALSCAGFGEVTLTFEFADLAAHVGQALSLRAVDYDTRVEVARVQVPAVPSAALRMDVSPFTEGRTYQIDYYLDQNANGVYDAPPVDAAWRFYVSSIIGPGLVEVVHETAFTDIQWPPAIDGTVAAGEYRHTMIDPETGIRVDWQNDLTTLYVALVSPGTGWVAIGFDPTSRMQGANYILGAVADGVLSITDEFGASGVTHRTDAQTNIIQAAGQEAGGATTLEFAIPLASGDAEDKPLVPGQLVTVLLAMSSSQDSFSARHSARATITITLDGGN
jgi:hypothetical protein